MAARQTLLYDDIPIGVKMLTAGTSGCIADFLTFPLDTAKVRLQIQGEGKAIVETALASNSGAAFRTASANGLQVQVQYSGLFGTIITIAKKEGPKALYNGLSAGLQRQMAFASVRLGFYDSVKALYQPVLDGKNRSGVSIGVGTKVAAGLTTGAMAVFVGQPTDVVKIRFQAETNPAKRYKSTFQAYRHIAAKEGFHGLWRGILPNVARNAIINVAEIVCYDVVKEAILVRQLLEDSIPCHFVSALVAGLSATIVASPVDVVKTRYMNAAPGTYRGAVDCAVRTALQEGPRAFYKGFFPSFTRLVSWNIFMWIIYEQMKKAVVDATKNKNNKI